MKKRIILTLILALCLPLLACSGSDTPEELVVEETSGSEQPVATVETSVDAGPVISSGTPVTHLDQIVGTWIAPADLGNFVTTIYPDGIFSVATSIEELEKGSTDSWQLVIEDGQISASGFALCLGETGSYLAVINPDSTLKFTTIIDSCDPRLRKMDRSLPGRLSPYNLIYHRVE